jgi:hypothetical protein
VRDSLVCLFGLTFVHPARYLAARCGARQSAGRVGVEGNGRLPTKKKMPSWETGQIPMVQTEHADHSTDRTIFG